MKYVRQSKDHFMLYHKGLYRGEFQLMEIPKEDRDFFLRAVIAVYSYLLKSERAFDMDKKTINEAMDNRFDGVESCVIVEELLELEAKNKQLKKRFDCLAELVILRNPETWECYLEDIKQALKGE